LQACISIYSAIAGNIYLIINEIVLSLVIKKEGELFFQNIFFEIDD